MHGTAARQRISVEQLSVIGPGNTSRPLADPPNHTHFAVSVGSGAKFQSIFRLKGSAGAGGNFSRFLRTLA
jgi:hypothetical protein